MDVTQAINESNELHAAIKWEPAPALMAVRRGEGIQARIDRYRQRQDMGEFERLPVNWPLNGLHGDENPNGWESLTAWPDGRPPEE